MDGDRTEARGSGRGVGILPKAGQTGRLYGALTRLGARFPGKDIWITEWSPRGGNPFAKESVTQGMAMHLVSRAHLTFLRHPAVSMSLYFMMNFTPDKTPYGAFDKDAAGGYAPWPAALAVGWFAKASNGGTVYRRLVEPGAARKAGGGLLDEGYTVIEGADFKHANGATVLVQNAGPTARTVSLEGFGRGSPSAVDAMATPDLVDSGHRASRPGRLPLTKTVELTPYSLTRIVWG